MNRTITAAMTTAALIVGTAALAPAAHSEPKPAPFGKTNGLREAVHLIGAPEPLVAV